MEDIGIDATELAKRMGVHVRYVEKLLDAKEDMEVGPTTAKKLGKPSTCRRISGSRLRLDTEREPLING